MIALQMTDYEKGLKRPADLIAKPEPRSTQLTGDKTHSRRGKVGSRYPVISAKERERRIKLLRRAIAKAGTKAFLAEAIGIGDATVGRWNKGGTPIHDEPLARLEAFLAEGEGEGLRRGHGVAWCPSGAHYVPEGKMRVNEDGAYQALQACRDCQVRGDGPQASREVQAELEGKI